MSLRPKEEIGEEIHPDNDQFFRIEAGAKHNSVNTASDEAMKMYTVYSPAHHKDK